MPGDERLRLFIALELPDAVRETLVRWRSQALAQTDGLRLIGAGHLHVTLCFLGWRRPAEVEAIEAVCRSVARDAAGQASLQLGPVTWLPPRRPRVLAVELIDSAGGLGSWQAALSAGLEQGHLYSPEKRRFRAHVTVARVARGARAPAHEIPPPPPVSFAAHRFTLFRSRLGPAGARYEPLASVEAGEG